MFGIWNQIVGFASSPTQLEIGNFLPKVSELFKDSTSAKDRKKRSPDEDNPLKNKFSRNLESSKTEISKNMVEQSLLASIVLLDFWKETILAEDNFNDENIYLFHFCRIEKTLKRIGPWAVLIGKSMIGGLTKFVDDHQLIDAINKFKNWKKDETETEFNKKCEILFV